MLSINDCIIFFLNELSAARKPISTVKSYKTDLLLFTDFISKEFKIQEIVDIGIRHISQFRVYLRDELEYKESTIDRKIYCLKKFFRVLKDYEYIDTNPMLRLVHEKHQNEEIPSYLTKDEINIILDMPYKLKDDNYLRNSLILKVLAYTGCRRSDLLNLDWRHINLEEKKIKMRVEKTSNMIEIPMHDKLFKEFIGYYNYLRPRIDEPVFLSAMGNRLSKTAFNSIIKKYVKASGLNKDFNITAHTFRHSFCTNLIDKVDVTYIQSFTAHKDIRSVQKYCHINTQQKQKAINLLYG